MLELPAMFYLDEALVELLMLVGMREYPGRSLLRSD